MKRLLAGFLAALLASPVNAAVVTIGVKDAAGVTRTFNVTTPTDITGALSGNIVVCDQAAGATCASVGTAGSPSTNGLTIQALTLGHGTAANAMRVELPTDGTGVVNVNNITGTVSLPTGAATSANQPTAVAAGGAATGGTGNLHMGAVTTAAPTYTTGNTNPLSLDTAGNLRVLATQSASAWNITNISGTVSLPTGAATSALQPTVNAFAGTTSAGTTGHLMFGAVTTAAPTYTTGNNFPLSLDLAGNLRVNVVAGGGSGGTSSSFGSAFPGTGTAIGFSDGTNMVAGRVTTYGTAPTGLNALAVNANVTNSNPNGRAVSGSSSPVVPSAAPTTYHLATNTAGTNALSVKGSSTALLSCELGNSTTAAGYFKIYNKATAPTVGTDVPVVTLIVPGPAAGGGGSNVVFGPGGLALTTGFAVATTSGLLDTDSSNGPAGITANCQYD